MKHTFLFVALIAVGIASCKKSDIIVTTPAASTKTAYYIDGISDVTIQKGNGYYQYPPYYYQSGILNLSVMYDHGNQERVSLSLEGVPTGLATVFSSASGFPSFQTLLSFADSGVAAGNYALKLVANADSSGRKSYSFNVHVLDAPDCSGDVVGNGYATQNYCASAGSYSQNLTKVTGQPGRVLFSNFDNTGAQVYGTVDCNNNNITIPSQTVNGATYQGSGYYQTSGTQRTININYARNSSSCSMQLRL